MNRAFLSPRELDIARLAAAGRSNAAIAAELGLTTPTVRNTLGRIYLKLHIPPERNARVVLAGYVLLTESEAA